MAIGRCCHSGSGTAGFGLCQPTGRITCRFCPPKKKKEEEEIEEEAFLTTAISEEEAETRRLDGHMLALAPRGVHPLERGAYEGAFHLTPNTVGVPPKLPGLSPTVPLREISKLKELRSGSSDLPDNMRFII
jgi:hypothetical protein